MDTPDDWDPEHVVEQHADHATRKVMLGGVAWSTLPAVPAALALTALLVWAPFGMLAMPPSMVKVLAAGYVLVVWAALVLICVWLVGAGLLHLGLVAWRNYRRTGRVAFHEPYHGPPCQHCGGAHPTPPQQSRPGLRWMTNWRWWGGGGWRCYPSRR